MNFSNELEHYGVLGMKWGRRRGNKEARGGISRIASATADHYSISAAKKATAALGYKNRGTTKRDVRLMKKADKRLDVAKDLDTFTKSNIARMRRAHADKNNPVSKIPMSKLEKRAERDIKVTSKITNNLRNRAARLQAKTNAGKSREAQQASNQDLAAANRILSTGKMTPKDLAKAYRSVGLVDLAFIREA